MIYQRLYETLKKMGLEPLETEGRQFDPNLHQAVERVETTDERKTRPFWVSFRRGYNFKGSFSAGHGQSRGETVSAVNP